MRRKFPEIIRGQISGIFPPIPTNYRQDSNFFFFFHLVDAFRFPIKYTAVVDPRQIYFHGQKYRRRKVRNLDR